MRLWRCSLLLLAVSCSVCSTAPAGKRPSIEKELGTLPREFRGSLGVLLKMWRFTLLRLLERNCRERDARLANCSALTDVYEFGVFTGRALKGMTMHRKFSSRVRRFWGFDSFSGMPDEHPAGAREAKLANAFPAGTFSVAAIVSKTKSRKRPVEVVNAFIADARVTLLEGFFNETLCQLDDFLPSQLAVLRIDSDMFLSVLQTLCCLYDRVAVGGWLIIDDWVSNVTPLSIRHCISA